MNKVNISEIGLESIQVSADSFNYVEAVHHLSFLVYISLKDINAETLYSFRSVVDPTFRSLIQGIMPTNLFSLSSSEQEYNNLYIISCYQSFGNIFLRLESPNFTCVGTVNKVKASIYEKLGDRPILSMLQ